MKISRGDSSQSIERSSSELLMKFDSSKLERLGDGAGSGFPQPSCLLQMRHWVKCLNLGSAWNNSWGFWTLVCEIATTSGCQYGSDRRGSMGLTSPSPRRRWHRHYCVRGWHLPGSEQAAGCSAQWWEQCWPRCFSLCSLQLWWGAGVCVWRFIWLPFGNGASSSQAFSSKSCCYLRSRFSCMIRAKGEFISRLHLQQIERQISWGKRRCNWSNKTCKNMGPLGNTDLGRASQDTSQFFVKGRYTTLIKRNP